jgi:hypothetical protein
MSTDKNFTSYFHYLIDEILEYIGKLRRHLRDIEAQPVKGSEPYTGLKTKPLISYQWDNKKFTLVTNLHKKIKGKLIDKDATINNFKAIFTGKPVTKITPLKWHDGTASELLYFIIQLQGKTFIPKEKRMNYKRIKGCFIKNDGSPFEENFKEINQSLKQNTEGTLCSEKRKFIDKILNYLSD